MIHEITVPSAGESVTEAYIGEWRKQSGDIVNKGEILVELESQKATFELESEFAGRLEIVQPEEGATVGIGDVIAKIDDSADASASAPASNGKAAPAAKTAETQQAAPQKSGGIALASPSVRQMITERNLDISQLTGTGPGGQITLQDVENYGKPKAAPAAAPRPAAQPETPQIPIPIDEARGDVVKKAKRLRQQIAKNLVAAQQNAAILTTFNEVDMTSIMNFRKANKEEYKAKHGVSLGMASFFSLAAAKALMEFKEVNAYFDGKQIVYHNYVDLSIAVSTEKGLVVPVIRDVQDMDIVKFEQSMKELATKARENKLSIPDMTGGTFTVSNGGVFGSMLSTPILNAPQTAILGLHNILQRPMVVDGKIEARPMMYVALSYDHRLIDGKDAVQFLVRIKELCESVPEWMDL